MNKVAEFGSWTGSWANPQSNQNLISIEYPTWHSRPSTDKTASWNTDPCQRFCGGHQIDNQKRFSLDASFDSFSTFLDTITNGTLANGMLQRSIRPLSSRHLSVQTDGWLFSRSPSLPSSVTAFAFLTRGNHAWASARSSQPG